MRKRQPLIRVQAADAWRLTLTGHSNLPFGFWAGRATARFCLHVALPVPCCLANHHVCELYHAIIFLYYVFHLSTTFVYSTTLPVHQPFEAVMEVSGVKTRYSEQTMLPAEADILLVTESSSEEDSETDDQSYFPLRSMLKLGRVVLPMSCMLSCIA